MFNQGQQSILVGGIPTPLKNMKEFVNIIPDVMENTIHVPNHQPVIKTGPLDHASLVSVSETLGFSLQRVSFAKALVAMGYGFHCMAFMAQEWDRNLCWQFWVLRIFDDKIWNMNEYDMVFGVFEQLGSRHLQTVQTPCEKSGA